MVILLEKVVLLPKRSQGSIKICILRKTFLDLSLKVYIGVLSPTKKSFLDRPLEEEELKRAIWSGDTKRAPSPNALTPFFFKTSLLGYH